MVAWAGDCTTAGSFAVGTAARDCTTTGSTGAWSSIKVGGGDLDAFGCTTAGDADDD